MWGFERVDEEAALLRLTEGSPPAIPGRRFRRLRERRPTRYLASAVTSLSPPLDFTMSSSDFEDKAIGVIDLHKNHPEPGITYLGLLLLTENLFGLGLGRKSYQL